MGKANIRKAHIYKSGDIWWAVTLNPHYGPALTPLETWDEAVNKVCEYYRAPVNDEGVWPSTNPPATEEK
jgi:hypothetical protein